MARTVTGRTLGEIQCAMHKMDAEGAKERCFFTAFQTLRQKDRGKRFFSDRNVA
uniref:Uncharacterized protein n=1 Tax=Histophilus somni (strain 129Pt) TaxID=205914 RepID=Q0I292_HISS1